MKKLVAEWWPEDPGGPMYISVREVEPGEVKKSVPRDTEIILDYDEDGNLLGIEILGIEARNPLRDVQDG